MIEPVPDNIIYCYGIFSDIVPLIESMGILTVAGLPDEHLKTMTGTTLLVLDDLMNSTSKEYLDSLFTMRSHHEGLGCILIVQNIFAPNIKVARGNAHYLVLMNGVAYRLQVRILGSQLFPGKIKFFQDAYQKAVNEDGGSLLIDLHPKTPDQLRLRANIFPGQENIVYLPK
uniref:Uncharacterized protein n=1 Tax=Panagrolaimus sp. JU765 TaxID=591449 RepID=A0AC34R1B4_9BILA